MSHAVMQIEAELRAMLDALEEAPRRRHERFLKELDLRTAKAPHSALQEIRAMFKAAFPNSYFVFLVKRPIDAEAWATVFTDEERATNYPNRVSQVVEVRL